MLIFPRVRFKPELIDKAPAGCIGGSSKSGWINESMFNEWFGHFVKFVNPSAKSAPVVLIMDGHSCHVKNLELIDQAMSNNVICCPYPVTVPTDCSHLTFHFFYLNCARCTAPLYPCPFDHNCNKPKACNSIFVHNTRRVFHLAVDCQNYTSSWLLHFFGF